jgi:hypothetical protein
MATVARSSATVDQLMHTAILGARPATALAVHLRLNPPFLSHLELCLTTGPVGETKAILV